MKTLITSIIVAAILFFNSTIAKAGITVPNNDSADHAVDWYINALINGRVENLDKLFDDSFTQSVTNKGKIIPFTKVQITDFLKANKNIQQQDCDVSYRLVEENANFSIAKVEMKYQKFTKVEYVTLCHDKQGWKISQILTVYP